MPVARPMQLPMAMEGRKMPAGIRMPNVTAVSSVFALAVTLREGFRREKSIDSSATYRSRKTV